MIEWTASLQPPLIAALLLWAGAVKLRGLRLEDAKRNALSRIVGEERTSAAWRTVGGAEIVVAAGLLLPAYPVNAVAASVLTAGFLGYLTYARIAAPDSSCGCMSSRLLPVSWRSFARAGMLLAMSVTAAGFADTWWPETFAGSPLVAGGVLLAEAVVFGALSAEFDHYWLHPLRQLKVQLTHPLANRVRNVPIESTIQQLQLSEAYARIGTSLVSDIQDSWDEGEWRIVCYAARHEGTAATAVFAVPLARYEPNAVRVVFVDEARGETVMAPA
ncbi:MAG: MauE/DoxX family redox-associated membrane protein [Micromonosporaceae bacterium]